MSRPLKEAATMTNELAEKVSVLEVELKGVQEGLSNQARRLDDGFREVFARIDQIRSRPVPWGAIGVVASVILALAGWANAYFGQSIEAARKTGEMNSGEIRRLEDRVNAHQAAAFTEQIRQAEARGALQERVDTLSRRANP